MATRHKARVNHEVLERATFFGCWFKRFSAGARWCWAPHMPIETVQRGAHGATGQAA